MLQAYEDWRDSVSSGGRESTSRVRNPSWKMISELMGGMRSTKACYHRIYFLLSLESEERLKLISQEEAQILLHSYQDFRGMAENGRTDWNAIYSRLPDAASRGCTLADIRLQCLRLLHHDATNSAGQGRGQVAKKQKRHSMNIPHAIHSHSGAAPVPSHHYTL